MTGTRAAETAARKERLIAAATALAAEGGYDAVQMRDVAARAEVALGTLYRHYASKDQLLLAAMAQQATTLRERLVQRPPTGDTPAARVSDVLKRASRSLERAPLVTKAMLDGDVVAGSGDAPTEGRDRHDVTRDHRRRRRRRRALQHLHRSGRHRPRAGLGLVRGVDLLEQRPESVGLDGRQPRVGRPAPLRADRASAVEPFAHVGEHRRVRGIAGVDRADDDPRRARFHVRP